LLKKFVVYIPMTCLHHTIQWNSLLGTLALINSVLYKRYENSIMLSALFAMSSYVVKIYYVIIIIKTQANSYSTASQF